MLVYGFVQNYNSSELQPSPTALALLCAWVWVGKINPVLTRRLRVPQL